MVQRIRRSDIDDTEPTVESGGYGFPARLWRSPLRGPWLTSVFGSVLLVTLPIVILTGLLSYIAYGPRLGQAIPADVGWLKLPTFDWPTNPPWLYRLTQGLHVGLGLILIPVVLAKLWSVIPRLFAWPPVRSIAQLLERISLLMLVGGILFEIVTGVLNIQYDYIFGFSFYTAHYFGAWVFITGFVMHVAIKSRRMWPVCARCRCVTCCAPGAPTPKPSRGGPTDSSPPTPPRNDEPSRRAGAGRRWRPVPGGHHRRSDAGRLHPARRRAAAARAPPRRRAQRTSRSTGPRPRPASPRGTQSSAGGSP